MRGVRAKRIRRKVYGDMSPRERKYFVAVDRRSGGKLLVADQRRRAYQREKRVKV